MPRAEVRARRAQRDQVLLNNMEGGAFQQPPDFDSGCCARSRADRAHPLCSADANKVHSTPNQSLQVQASIERFLDPQLCLPQAVLPFLTIGLFYLVFFRLGVWHAFSLVSGALRSSAAQTRSSLYEGCDHVLHRGSFAAGAARPHEVVRCARSLPMLSLMCVIRAAGKTATASQVLFNSLSVAGGARLSVAASRNLMLTCLLQVSPC